MIKWQFDGVWCFGRDEKTIT